MTEPGPQPRRSLRDVPPYVAGRPAAVRPGRPAYKLSSNENPHAPPAAVLEAVAEAARTMNRYPDMGNAALYDALASRLDVPVSDLAAGTGSVGLLFHLVQAFCEPGDTVVHAWRSFEAYPIAVSVGGATSVRVSLTADGRHDLDAMTSAVDGSTRILLVCTPNNPTGPAVSHSQVTALLDRVPRHVVVVVDEAYREFVRAEDPVDAVALYRDRPNVVVLRTFAKAYGLAGLRVGYLVAQGPVATAVRACALPFGVSSVAQAAAVAALEHEDALMARVEAVVAERDRVVRALAAQGWSIPDAQGNFVWLPLGVRTGEFAAAAEEAGTTVRPFADVGVRVSIGEPAGNDIVLEVAAAFVPQ